MNLRVLALAALICLAAAPLVRAADAGPEAEARKTQARHDLAVKTAEAEVKAKQRDVDNFQKAIEENDKRLAKIDKEHDAAQAQLDEIEGAKQKLADAKSAMEAADARVAREYQDHHNTTTNSGGASDEAVKAQEKAQKEFQRLKRVAATSDSDAPAYRQRVAAIETSRKNEDKKKDDNLKKLEDAKAALEAARQKLAEVQAAPAVPPAETKPEDKAAADPAGADKPKDPPTTGNAPKDDAQKPKDDAPRPVAPVEP